jgi:hypothetical protein
VATAEVYPDAGFTTPAVDLPAQPGPRLDDATKLGNGLVSYRVAVYPTAGEVVLTVPSAPRDPEAPTKLGPAHPDRARQVAQSRARTRVRRYCKANGLHRLCTLTYRDQTADMRQVHRDLAAFVKRLRARGFRGQLFAYLWVREAHQSGMLHVHVALPKFLPKPMLEACWGKGFVDVRALGSHSESSSSKSSRAAGYLAKYVGKAFEDEAGAHRYEVGQGFEPERVDELVRADRVTATGHVAQRFFGGEAPSFVWTSEGVESWEGPPVAVLFWPDGAVA